MGDFTVRRVVTGHDAVGRSVVAGDGVPPATVSASGFGVSELLWLDGPLVTPGDGGDRDGGGFPLEPPKGGLSSRLIRLPPGDWLRIEGDDPDRPGRHVTDTLDLVWVVEGRIVLGLDDGEHELGPGEAVVQRGTPHRWRVAGDAPCTYFVTMLRPVGGRPSPLAPSLVGASHIRRVVTGAPAIDGRAPVALDAGGTRIVDLWHTGGPLAVPGQGGDPSGPFELEPPPGGAWMRWVEIAPGAYGPEEGWHATATVDVDLIVSGRMALDLRGGSRTEVGPGDVVVQRGTEHRWEPLDGAPAAMISVMLAIGGS